MTEQWQQLNEKYSNFSKREKLIIFFTGCGLLIYIFVMLFIEPSWTQHSKQQQELTSLKQQIAELNASSDELKQALQIDINLPLNQQIQQLNEKLGQVNFELDQISAELVNTEQMTLLLQDMLKQSDKVKLISLTAKPAIDLMANKTAEKEQNIQKSAISLYQQNLHIVIEGQYQDIYQFLANIENLPWQLNWQNFNYRVIQHPKAQLSIEIATLSLTEDVLKL